MIEFQYKSFKIILLLYSMCSPILIRFQKNYINHHIKNLPYSLLNLKCIKCSEKYKLHNC